MMMRYTAALGIILFLCTHSTFATEIDSFNDRDPTLKDATVGIDRLINHHFQIAIDAANRSRSCDKQAVMDALSDQLHGIGWAKIENEIVNDSSIEKRQTKVKDSIYQDFTAFESPVLVVANLGYVMRFDDNYVGTDKFGHFFQEGYQMYRHVYIYGNKTRDAVAHSEFTERTYYGLLTTGVYSYGDLASNYDGLYFWERVADSNLPLNQPPYFSCENKIWRVNTAFNISDYVNSAWDEGINCSTYRNPGMEIKVTARITELENKKGVSLQCPIRPKECTTISERYGNMAQHVVTPKCFS